MRTQYRRRSWTSLLIWTTACVAIAASAAWQFHWWPTAALEFEEASSGADHPQTDKKPGPVSPANHEQPADASRQGHDIFTAQTEPEVPDLPQDVPPFAPAEPPDFGDFPGPPKLLPANPDAKPIPVPSRLVRTVEGELPPPKHAPALPKDSPQPPSIQLLKEESPAPPPAAPPELPAGLKAETLQQIDAWLATGHPKDDLAAHKELSTLYWNHPEWREFLRSRIEKTAKSIYFSPQPHYMTPYTIQPGDQLTKIAKLYNVPWEYLAKLNEADPRKIRPGQKLKVIKGPFAAVVDLDRFELTIQHHGFFVKRYKVGIGKDGTTPIGEFTVKNKLTNPTYYGTDRVIAADDPQNPLGEYWIDIGDSYGIHGTIDPDSIGKAESKGCLRMRNEDAAEVFGFLGQGAKVIIRR